MTGLAAAAARARTWLFDAALPLWAERGVATDGSFHEALSLDGRPQEDAVRRMRVQARQIYVFSEAALLGWEPGRDVSRRGLERFIERCWHADGGWIHTLAPSGAPLDTRRDTYDQAFALFSLAYAHRALGDARARDYADRTLRFLDGQVRDASHGGYLEGCPPSLPRRSNPHMHLLEAMLAWAELTQEALFAERAGELIRLFRDRFFDPATGTLGEYFEQDWSRAGGAPGQVVEPGHHFEWAWLLCRASALGVADATAEAEALYDFGIRNGLDARGLAVDEVDPSGRPVRRSRRAWPQTELLKAQLAMIARGRASPDDAARTTHAIMDSYLAVEPAGSWMDQFDASGRACCEQVPASTFYHLMVAFRCLFDAAEAEAVRPASPGRPTR